VPIIGTSADASPTDHVRVECAFTTAPGDWNPAYQDITAFVDLTTGIRATVGRTDEYATAQTGTCAVALVNTDARFTVGNTSSPYWPNLKIRKRLRVSYRDPAIGGNLVDPASASFEDGTTGLWAALTSTPTLANSGTHTFVMPKALLITWPTASADAAAAAWPCSLVIGRTYTFGVQVYVPATHPAVQLVQYIGTTPTTVSTASTVTDAFQQLTVTFTATTRDNSIGIRNHGAATSGQQVWADAFQGDEGSSLYAFTTTPPPIRYRHTGFVEEWPTEWPTGGDTYALAQVTSTDRLKPLGKAALRSLIEQEYLLDTPAAYYTLGEGDGSTTAGDTSGVNTTVLSVLQHGAGGAITFGANTGPGTDGLSAPAFAPVSVTVGKSLTTAMNAVVGGPGLTVEAFVLTTGSGAAQFVAYLSLSPGVFVALEVTAAGQAQARMFRYDAVALTLSYTLNWATAINNGLTHHLAVTEAVTGGTVTATLYVDGISRASTTYTQTTTFSGAQFSVGGAEAPYNELFTGTISHVAAYNTALTAARVLAHYQAGTTGFAGERSDQRIARYATYAGLTPAEQALEVGASTSIAFVDITGATALSAMQDVTNTENGVLFIDGQGLLRFQARSHRYNAVSRFTVTAPDIDPSSRFAANDQYLVNDVTASRATGVKARAVDQTSVTDYDRAPVEVVLLTTSDLEVIDAANWRSHATSTVVARLPNLTIDLVTSQTLSADALALTLGTLITASGLPSQAPSSSVDLFVEGWSETISSDGWVMVLNTSPGMSSNVWVLDSPVYSQLDSTTKLAY